MTRRSIIPIVVCLALLAPAAPVVGQEPVSKELKKQVARALETKRSDAREIQGSMGIVHLYVKRLRENKKNSTALSTLNKAIKVAPWDMPCQIDYAELLYETRRKKKAGKKARWILAHASEDRARAGAWRLLGETVSLETNKLERRRGGKPRVVLLPYGPCDLLLLQSLEKEVEGRLPVPIDVRAADLGPLPQADRNGLEFLAADRRTEFEKEATAEEAAAAAKAVGATVADLKKIDHLFVTAYRRWLIHKEAWKRLLDFDRDLAEEKPSQWDGGKLRKKIDRGLASLRHRRDIYIAVTRADIFLGKNMRYNFAVSGGEIAIMSYARFLPWFTQEDPDWKRLVERGVKQVLNSIGRCAGITKCPIPECPCSTATGLESHDAKGYTYCEDCQPRVLEALK